MLATTAAHACETVLQDPAGLELLDHLADHLAPVPPAPSKAFVVYRAEFVAMILDEAVQRRTGELAQRSSGLVATKVPDYGEFVLAELTQTFDKGRHHLKAPNLIAYPYYIQLALRIGNISQKHADLVTHSQKTK
ncbi:MAG: hypothetical protein ACE5HT_15150 [Gemmatimonadales bacterium]